MRYRNVAAFVSIVVAAPLVRAQSAPSSLEACRVENASLRQEVARLNEEVARLNGAVLVLSKQLGGTTPPTSDLVVSPPPRSGPSRLKVLITTKFNTGQGCSISIDDREAGRIDYPSVEGKGTVMEYSSGFIEVGPGDHRVTVSCTQVDGKKGSSVYTDQTFSPGREYVYHTKINIWSKVLQQVSFNEK